MNQKKLTLEQFVNLKKKCQNILENARAIFENEYNNPNFNVEELEQKLFNEYFAAQSELLSYDLSDIPYEAWKDFEVIADDTHIADFSKTRANIDFNIIPYDHNLNLKSCNIRNLNKSNVVLNPKYFDEQIIQNNPTLFLSNSFSDEFIEKYFQNLLTLDDLVGFSLEQVEELNQKQIGSHFKEQQYYRETLSSLGLYKIIELYSLSKEDYFVVNELLKRTSYIRYRSEDENSFFEKLSTAQASEIKNICYSYFRGYILKYKYSGLSPSQYPKLFVEENDDIFLINANIPDAIRDAYYNRKLYVDDLIRYYDIFKNIPVDYFMYDSTFQKVSETYGIGTYQELIQKYPDVFLHLEKDYYNRFSLSIDNRKTLEENFIQSVKKYLLEYVTEKDFMIKTDDKVVYNVPEWLKSMNFVFIEKLETIEDLKKCNSSTVILNENQQKIVEMLNINNILRFEKETGFFSYKQYEYSRDLEMFDTFVSYFISNKNKLFSKIDFKNGTLSYEEFMDQFASCLDIMRKNNVFTDVPNYDWIRGEFRDKHPEIFIDINAPELLKKAFYGNRITPEFIFNHKDYIHYLVDKDMLNTINAKMTINMPGLTTNDGMALVNSANFIDEYVKRYDNEKFLELLARYGEILSDIEIASFNNEIDDPKAIEKSLRDSIYSKILKGNINYSYLENNFIFVSEHPELFVDFSKLANVSEEEKLRLKNAFYSGRLEFKDIKLYPELMTILKDKNLKIAFGNKLDNELKLKFTVSPQYTDLHLLEIYGNEKFLKLCSKYGNYMNNITHSFSNDMKMGKHIRLDELTFEEVSKLIENTIAMQCLDGSHYYHIEDAPDFLKIEYPQLFLEEDAPEELKKYFYNRGYGHPLTFEVLKNHKEWLPYLKGKSVSASLLRQSEYRKDMQKFFKLFGEETALKLGINRCETVTQMINNRQVELMKSWYDKTGQKFIPDFVVMQNFDIEEADKFLLSGSNWSSLMRIKHFSSAPESRDAMLKLAYSFGAFDQDQRGYKKLLDLLTGLPKKIDSDKDYIFNIISLSIDHYSQRKWYTVNGRITTKEENEKAYLDMMNYLTNSSWEDDLDRENIIKLFQSIKKEIPDFDFSKDLFSQIYRKNDDDSYTLSINTQSCPKTSEAVLMIFQDFESLPVLTPDKAHKLFGGFTLKYDPAFREFLLSNLDEIYEHPEYVTYIASIQKQFSEIKATNSNRTLTLDLAISYVQNNKYENVEVGNERVAEISAIAGYSQYDFDTLQQIYNYGKQRTFSSIPRIEKTSGKYTYEILRLDDPLAMAIGTLTDCCQELGNVAEVCMEHSMVDKNGRVFVIKDELGNIVAQSWVWRNKDVLCFDNIEIPDKAFSRAEKENSQSGRDILATDVFNIYKQAAHELIEADEAIYKQLLENGKITKEQYDGLRLGKVTVGLGYNDIAAILKRNSVNDKSVITRPLQFTPPVKLSSGLYTNDSNTQHILEEREDRKQYDGETLAVHSDAYIEYDDSNFSKKMLLTLEKLELVTEADVKNLNIYVDEYAEDDHLVTEIAENYGLNPETSKILMNPNFAIIYDIYDDVIRIGDLLFNTKVENNDISDKVAIQIRMALEQITQGKKVHLLKLDENKIKMYETAMNLTNEIDIERGVGFAK